MDYGAVWQMPPGTDQQGADQQGRVGNLSLDDTLFVALLGFDPGAASSHSERIGFSNLAEFPASASEAAKKDPALDPALLVHCMMEGQPLNSGKSDTSLPTTSPPETFFSSDGKGMINRAAHGMIIPRSSMAGRTDDLPLPSPGQAEPIQGECALPVLNMDLREEALVWVPPIQPTVSSVPPIQPLTSVAPIQPTLASVPPIQPALASLPLSQPPRPSEPHAITAGYVAPNSPAPAPKVTENAAHVAQLMGTANDARLGVGVGRPPIGRRSVTEKRRRHRVSAGFKQLERAIPASWLHQKCRSNVASRTDIASLLHAAVDFIEELEEQKAQLSQAYLQHVYRTY
ncbi:hypothetical protein CLOM_g8925 [Closterium sp. NIES-68]|nr:hypothetical protein CLOM_g8925 [Closterium sp. NIES-68]GJP70151.1 hypothetical protein CLOP_g1129 [Closterium sp. NIES-67]